MVLLNFKTELFYQNYFEVLDEFGNDVYDEDNGELKLLDEAGNLVETIELGELREVVEKLDRLMHDNTLDCELSCFCCLPKEEEDRYNERFEKEYKVEREALLAQLWKPLREKVPYYVELQEDEWPIEYKLPVDQLLDFTFYFDTVDEELLPNPSYKEDNLYFSVSFPMDFRQELLEKEKQEEERTRTCNFTALYKEQFPKLYAFLLWKAKQELAKDLGENAALIVAQARIENYDFDWI